MPLFGYLREYPPTFTHTRNETWRKAADFSVKIVKSWGQSAGKKKITFFSILRDYMLNILYKDMKLTADWICGFVEGEGSFVISITKIPNTKSEQVRLIFKVTQHLKNVQVLYAIKGFFEVGLVKRQTKDPKTIWEYTVSRFEHLRTKIIPFFEKNHLHTSKKFDFLRFRKVAIMMARKDHLTPEGLAKIKILAKRMNNAVAFSESELDSECVGASLVSTIQLG